jgi:hypothetical protein
MVHQQEAAKSFQNGDYSQAAERLNMAIKDVSPYLPDTRRIMARSYCDLAQVIAVLDQLAIVYIEQAKYPEAERLYLRYRSQFSNATRPLKTLFWRKPLTGTPSYSGS